MSAESLARRLAGMVPAPDPDLDRSRLVGIDGRSGSGKTDLAADLTHSLAGAGRSTAVVHLDDLYAGWSGLADAVPVLCRDIVLPLSRGLRASYRRYDWLLGSWAEQVVVPAAQVVLVEGVGALAGGCRDRFDLRVWLEAPTRVRRARALHRDGEVFAPHWEHWAAQEERVHADGAGRTSAHVVIDTGSGSDRPMVELQEEAPTGG